MKIATRIALLQWQANPADPANLWRLIIAWVTPGMRESPSTNEIDWSKNPYRERDNDGTAEGNAGHVLAVKQKREWSPRIERAFKIAAASFAVIAVVFGGSYWGESPRYEVERDAAATAHLPGLRLISS